MAAPAASLPSFQIGSQRSGRNSNGPPIRVRVGDNIITIIFFLHHHPFPDHHVHPFPQLPPLRPDLDLHENPHPHPHLRPHLRPRPHPRHHLYDHHRHPHPPHLRPHPHPHLHDGNGHRI